MARKQFDQQAPCGHCGKKRALRTVAVEHAGEVRKLDMCRPCESALKEAIKFRSAGGDA